MCGPPKTSNCITNYLSYKELNLIYRYHSSVCFPWSHKNTLIAFKIHETHVGLHVVLVLWHYCCPKQYGCRKSSNYISKWEVILFVQFCTRGL